MRRARSALGACVEWSFPIRTLVGSGQRREVPAILAAYGSSRPLIVTDPTLAKQPFFSEFVTELKSSSLSVTTFSETHPNPLDTDIRAGAEMFRSTSSDSVICIGGGSGLDAGKSIAMVAESGLQLIECDYFAGTSPTLRDGCRLVPCVTLPTTAGTGAEMDSGSMYTDTAAKVKRCAGHSGLPLTAILDPDLTVGLPASLTAWTGMDALVHALEALFVPMYHPMCDGIALQALQKIHHNLEAVVKDGSNLEARQEMLVASAMAAVSFQKGLGGVHGLSEPMGAVYNCHHGLTNAVLLPYFLKDLGSEIEAKCQVVSRTLRLPSNGTSGVIDWVEDLGERLKIPRRIGDLVSDMDDAAVDAMAVKAAANPTGFTNAVPFGAADYKRVLRAAL